MVLKFGQGEDMKPGQRSACKPLHLHQDWRGGRGGSFSSRLYPHPLSYERRYRILVLTPTTSTVVVLMQVLPDVDECLKLIGCVRVT